MASPVILAAQGTRRTLARRCLSERRRARRSPGLFVRRTDPARRQPRLRRSLHHLRPGRVDRQPAFVGSGWRPPPDAVARKRFRLRGAERAGRVRALRGGPRRAGMPLPLTALNLLGLMGVAGALALAG